MPSSKRAEVPGDVFAKRPSALDKLTGAAPAPDSDAIEQHHGEAAVRQGSDTVIQQSGNTVLRQEGDAAMTRVAKPAGETEKTTFYLRPDQLDKLDELVAAYKRQTGQRKGVNRNDIVRRLIDRADLATVIGEGRDT